MAKQKSKMLGMLLTALIMVFVGFQITALLLGANPISSVTGIGSGSESPVLKMPLNTEGYNKLLEYDKTIQLDDQTKFSGFNVRLPCCAFAVTTDEKNKCGCGHHVAFAGLIKFMAKNGHAREHIQQEIDAWKPVFYPECASNKNLCDLR